MFFQMLSSFVQAAGAYEQGNAQAASARYNQQIDQYNSTVTAQEGAVAVQQQTERGEAAVGQERANAGASGLSPSGAIGVIQESAFNAQMDVLNTKYTYAARAQSQQMAANLQGMQAGNDEEAGMLHASSILMAGYGKEQQMQQSDNGYGASPFRIGGG